MDDACPLCHTEVTPHGRVGGPTEEAPNELQRELGRCQRAHELRRWLDEYGRLHGPWCPAG